jgi:subtilase family serine protease
MPTPRIAATVPLAAALLSLVFTLGMTTDAFASTRVQNACGVAPAGHVRCDAQILVSGVKSKPVHPKIHPITTGTHSHAVSHVATTTVLGEPQSGTPLYLQQAYDLTALSAQGANQTVAVVDAYNDSTAATDLATFRADSGLPACATSTGCLRVLNQLGAAAPPTASSSSWSVEESLDVDAVSALCPNCKIVLVEANSSGNMDMQTAIQAAVGAGANFISNSWSMQSARSPFSSNFSYPGVSVLAAAGDDGTATSGQSAYPAALPDVTAVGGTTLNATAASPRGFAETAWDDTGSGCDTYEAAPSWQPQTGCAGRAYNDISADGDPGTGLDVYDSQDGGWLQVGGSSLAAPLAAAYEAVTALNGTTPQWAYSDETLLNGVLSGSNGACSLALICNAGNGWNGPGGAGSISGDIVPGAPGIGGPDVNHGGPTYTESTSSNSAALQGGIYPNGESTSYYWQYGTTASYGSQTSTVTVPAEAGAVSVTAALAALTPATTYHYRLVATNASGTSYGYDFTLNTAAAQAQNLVAPVVAKPVKHKAVEPKPAKVKHVRQLKHKRAKHKTGKKHKTAKSRKGAKKHKAAKRHKTAK